MKSYKKLIIRLFFAVIVFTFAVPSLIARDKEFDSIVRHLQTTYQAKKVKIPFKWLARFAVKIVRPAGVKSFDFNLFKNLNFSSNTQDDEIKMAILNSLNPEWIPLLRVRSGNGERLFAYLREDGKNVKLMLVTIERDQAAVIRATFDPDKLVEFIDNPKIFGVSLGDKTEAKNQITRNKQIDNK